jgi:uncharacterized protein (DUF305 family)
LIPPGESTKLDAMRPLLIVFRRRLPTVLSLLLLAGCTSAGQGSLPAPAAEPPRAEEGPERADASERERLERLYWERVARDRDRYVEADVTFMQGMIAHHAQALLMVALVPERAADPSVRTLAARIENAQRDEIALMERWLAARGEAVPRWHIEGTALVVGWEQTDPGRPAPHHGHRPASHDMPGTLSQDRLDALAAAGGPEFDRLFLEAMIEHHRGAIEMVSTLFATDGAAQDPEVFRFASDVQVDQRTEIARMESMLRRMSGATAH